MKCTFAFNNYPDSSSRSDEIKYKYNYKCVSDRVIYMLLMSAKISQLSSRTVCRLPFYLMFETFEWMLQWSLFARTSPWYIQNLVNLVTIIKYSGASGEWGRYPRPSTPKECYSRTCRFKGLIYCICRLGTAQSFMHRHGRLLDAGKE